MEDLGDLSSFFDNIEDKTSLYPVTVSPSPSTSSVSSISSSPDLGYLIRDFDRNIISSDTLLYSTLSNNNFQIKTEEATSSIYDTEMFPVELDNLSFYTDDEDSAAENNDNSGSSSLINARPDSPLNLNTCGAISKTVVVPVIHVTEATVDNENERDQRSPSVASSINNTDEENDSDECDHRSPSVISSRHSSSDKDDDEDYIVEEMDEDEDDHSDEEYVIRKRHGSSSSNLDSDTDGDYDPDEKPKIVQKKRVRGRRNSRTSNRGITKSKSKSHTPTPQRRAPGTTLKITQWIVILLRDPEYNPSVITWHDEKKGIFMIKDTDKYASLWGKVKDNNKMTYEKLSRAMRYSYKNNELKTVRGQRLTYKFGQNMVNFRAKDPSDPNFEKIHSKSQK